MSVGRVAIPARGWRFRDGRGAGCRRRTRPPIASVLRDVAIVGGGCYGTFYARQLIRAAEPRRGRLPAAADRGSRPGMPVRARAGPRPTTGSWSTRRLGRVLRRLARRRRGHRHGRPSRRDRPLPPHAAPHVRLAGAPCPLLAGRAVRWNAARSRSGRARPTTCSPPTARATSRSRIGSAPPTASSRPHARSSGRRAPGR